MSDSPSLLLPVKSSHLRRNILVVLMLLIVLAAAISVPLFWPKSQIHPALASNDHPTGDRVLRIRALDPGNSWALPGYTANDVMHWLADLQPTTLNRITSNNQVGSGMVPTSPGHRSLTVQQFLQGILDNSSVTSMFPRLSLKDYLSSSMGSSSSCNQSGSVALFSSEATALFNLYGSLSPKQTLISLDNSDKVWGCFGNNAPTIAQQITANLTRIGFTGIDWGACMEDNIPPPELNNTATFAMTCAPPPSFSISRSNINQIKGYGSSIREIEGQIDFPNEMSGLIALPVDQEAKILTNLAGNQSLLGYHFMYPIIQTGSGVTWDSTQRFTSPGGPWHGQSLYQVTKGLLNSYNPVGPSDFSVFLAPYSRNIEALRAYMMAPPNPAQTPFAKIGLNPVYGLVQGDYVCGGYQPLASSLNNNDLMASKGLDYLNMLKGINSSIEKTTRFYLSQTWNNTEPQGWACTSITPQPTWTYACNDKHELLFGTASPCYQTIVSTCGTSGGAEAFITSHTGIQMIIESGVNGSCLSASKTSLNDLAMFINFLWLKGDPPSLLQARQIFNATLANWTATPGTGLNATVGGCFSAPYGPNPSGGVARARDLGFWLDMARGTGLWNTGTLARTVSQQVVNQIWAQQKPDGSIAVDYPTTSPAPCGGTSSTYPKDSGESDGLTIAAFDARVPGWFGVASQNAFPAGNRVVRIRALDANTAGTWALANYTGTDILRWLADLKPTTLNEFTSLVGASEANNPVPVCGTCTPLTVQQFLQASLDAAGPNATILPRLPLSEYLAPNSPAKFMADAQDMFNLYSSLSPRQTLLSVDETTAFLSAGHTINDIVSLDANLTQMGWTGISWGACAVEGLPSGVASFARDCVSTNGWGCVLPSIPALLQSQPSIREVECHIDYTTPFMGVFVTLSGDQQAAILKDLAANQTGPLGPYHYMYPVAQVSHGSSVSYDANRVFTSATGPYHNQSIYQVIKGLMNIYNPLSSGLPPPLQDFNISANPPSLSVTTGVSGISSLKLAGINGFAGRVFLSSLSNSSNLVCSINPSVLVPGSAILSCTSGMAGNFQTTVSAMNGTLSHSVTVVYHVAPPPSNTPPIISAPTGTLVVRTGSTLTFRVNVTDPDGDKLITSVGPLPVGAAFNALTGVFTWTPTTAQAGHNYRFAFASSDGVFVVVSNVVTVQVKLP